MLKLLIAIGRTYVVLAGFCLAVAGGVAGYAYASSQSPNLYATTTAGRNAFIGDVIGPTVIGFFAGLILAGATFRATSPG